jgi:hypothetical protein
MFLKLQKQQSLLLRNVRVLPHMKRVFELEQTKLMQTAEEKARLIVQEMETHGLMDMFISLSIPSFC